MGEQLDPLTLAMDLMRIDSTSGGEREIVDFLHGLLQQDGWRVRRIPVTTGRENIFATAVDSPLVTLSTHVDTVPPYIAPRAEGSRLWGRGACDAKGIAAAMFCAARRLRAREVPVALLFVVGEEVTHDGAHAANLFPTTSLALIDGEPTESTLAMGTKGALRITLRTSGRAAHSAYPDMGHSAIDDLTDLLHELKQLEWPSDPVLGNTTVNVGMISGGVADNVIAAIAEARIMIRTVTPPEQVHGMLEAWLNGRAELEHGIAVPPVKLNTIEGFPTSVVSFATDIPALTAWGTPYLFGPGSILQAHTDDEFIEIDELRSAVGAYERLAVAAMNRESGVGSRETGLSRLMAGD
ncbi:MAG: M20/M25/M40 family metallo-hydrolase [Gemmatimonadaceae bacterium]